MLRLGVIAVKPRGTMKMRAAMTGEQGGVLVMVAVFLPVLLLFVAFVIDIGNWFTHKRHLQVQADAAAFAGAVEFGASFGTEACDGADIESAARFYSGEADTGYNQQLGGTSTDDVHFVLNSREYFENSTAPDETVVEGSPCDARMVDVKMTETDLPLFLQIADRLFADVDYVNTHARVEIFQRRFFSDGLPFAVPDANPQVGRAYFVDETRAPDDPEFVLGSRELTRNGTQNGLAFWDNETDPFPLTMNTSKVGVRVAFGGGTSTTCGDPLVECYDLEDPGLGLLHVRGYSAEGSGAQPDPPLARSVYLYPGSCADPYFFDTNTQCTVGVTAEVDFGPCTAEGGLPPVGAKLTANLVGSNTDHVLAPDPDAPCPAGSSTSIWETTEPLPIDDGAGPVEFELKWEETQGSIGSAVCKAQGNNPCKGSFGVVQRTYSAIGDRSGPVRFAQLWEGGSAWANSFERCSAVQSSCTYDVVARIGVDHNLEEAAQNEDDPVVTLRLGAGQGNQTLDCDPAIPNLEQEIAQGCGPAYAVNQGTECPFTQIQQWFLDTPQPWECVAVQPGVEVGNLRKGMNERVHFEQNPNECVSPNHWSDFPDLPLDDPRIVSLFITPFGIFEGGTGNFTVPVTDFATFYVTGWDNSDHICPGDATYEADDPAPSKAMVGHFIKYVDALNDGGAGGELCDPDVLTPCVAVLTR
jgi:hypothetical protein